MNKRIAILFIVLASLLGASFLPIVTPPNTPLTSFNKTPGGAYPFGIKTVVIDAGHGGKDPGCLGITTSKEKDVALAISLKLGKYIEEKIPDVKVIFTRKTDIFLTLQERAEIANKNKADLFICIHANTACSFNKKTKQKTCNEEIYGTETYVMGLHKTNANLNVAKRENEAILLEKDYKKNYNGFDPNSETGYILLHMQQNAFLKQSLNFATKVQKAAKEKAGRFDKGVQQAGFLVLWRTAMPSVLIETEFLSNTQSENFVVSEKGQDHLSKAIFIAFRQYKDEVEGKLVKYDDEFENSAPYVPEKDKEKGTKDDSTGSPQAPGRGAGDVEKKPEVKSEKEEVKAIKDSVIIKKDPVIDTEIKNEIVPKDMSVKNTMAPIIKDSAHVLLPSPKGTPSESGSGQIFYKVQFLSSGQRVPMLSDKFKGLKEVGEYQDGTAYKYTAGEFKTLEDAMKYRGEMQTKGFKDCFVVKFKDGKRLKN